MEYISCGARPVIMAILSAPILIRGIPLTYFAWGAGFGFFSVMFQLFYCFALRYGSVSITVLTVNCSMIVPVCVSAFLFHEPLTLCRIIGIVVIILTFILILATFNVVGSLSMLMIDKRKDTEILKSMGADNRLIQRIFMNEGLLISVAGGIIGLLMGIILVLLQQQFGFVKFGTGGNYVVDAYPVMLKFKDVVLIFATILVVGCTSAFLTVRHAMRKETASLKAN